MINENEVWAVEWNPKVKQIHIHTLQDLIDKNRRYIATGYGNPDWLLVTLARTPDEAHDLAEEVKFVIGLLERETRGLRGSRAGSRTGPLPGATIG
jgi:hypothetical protein